MPTRTQQSDTLACAYASHGDTKHVLLFPCDPKECFEMAADSFDLAESLQTPVILMSDLDLGMNDHVCLPMEWDDSRRYCRGKVLDREQLDALTQKFGRYLDTDGDGVCYRTIPGTHPEKGAFFTRGSSHDAYAAYTEDTDIYKQGMERLLRKWQTAKTLVPKPRIKTQDKTSTLGAVFYGTSAYASYEAMEMLEKKGIVLDTLRLRGFPFQDEVKDFMDQHETLFVIEQNRDGQMRTLLINELDLLPNKLISITHIDGTPIDARHICRSIEEQMAKIKPPKGGAQ
jgi:2-oxoglutarate ferredoxin oxidoreductase subunit alpha